MTRCGFEKNWFSHLPCQKKVTTLMNNKCYQTQQMGKRPKFDI